MPINVQMIHSDLFWKCCLSGYRLLRLEPCLAMAGSGVTDIGLRGFRPPAVQKGRGAVNLGGVLMYLSQASWYLNDLLRICCIIYWVPFAHTCKERELVALPQISYFVLAPMVSSNFLPKDTLPCCFQGKYIFPWVQRSP